MAAVTATISINTEKLIKAASIILSKTGRCPFFGIVPDELRPVLPKGFRFIMQRHMFLRAERDTDGKQFFVFRRRLSPVKTASRRDVRRTSGRLKLGQEYIDTRKAHQIRLSK